MPHHVRPIPFKPPRLIGLSERLLASLYENNYGGAVRRLNAIQAQLGGLDWAAAPVFEVNGLKREELIAHNSMVLHEVYFDGLGGKDGLGSPAVDPTGELTEAIVQDFGGLDAWKAQFTAMGRALGGGSGWVILAWSGREGRLVNHWAANHAHMPAGGVPILSLDMYEHAYHMDFGANAGAYVEAFMQNIHWDRPARRFAQAVGTGAAAAPPNDAVAAETLRDMLSGGDAPLVLDICLADDMAKRYDKLPGATALAPEKIDNWIGSLPADKPIVAYCVYGYQVSGDAVAAMRARGLDARTLAGGIAAWHAIGAPTEPLS
ncbi:MAG: Fe-Mn family superoxide dismutase [Rhodospirillaceae bacterium]